jgi:hypothetical protein
MQDHMPNHKLILPGIMVLALMQPALAQSRQDLVDKVDIFAVDYLDNLQQLSFWVEVEYCGLFGIDDAGNIVATPAQMGDEYGCDIAEELYSLPGLAIIASYHTHGQYNADAYNEVPSTDDMVGDFEEGIDGYISTPSGRVWAIRVDDNNAVQLCGPGCVLADPNYQECTAHLPDQQYTIESLILHVRNDPGYC